MAPDTIQEILRSESQRMPGQVVPDPSLRLPIPVSLLGEVDEELSPGQPPPEPVLHVEPGLLEELELGLGEPNVEDPHASRTVGDGLNSGWSLMDAQCPTKYSTV
jgi:hypothetical protein